MRLLLAGASGFIGRHLVKRLRNDHEVYALARTELGASSQGEVCRWEAGEPLDLGSLPDRADVVCYAAASRNHRLDRDGVDDLLKVNVTGVVPLLQWARDAQVRQFIYLSTGSVYGAAAGDEEQLAAPRDFYGASKLAGETLAGGYGRYFEVFIPRLYTPYGPGQDDRLVPDLMARISSGTPVHLHGEHGFVVQPSYVGDVVEVLAQAIERRWSGVANVCGPRALTLRDLAVEIGAVVGRPPCFVPAETSSPPPDQQPNRRRLTELLGSGFAWTDLDTGLQNTWRTTT